MKKKVLRITRISLISIAIIFVLLIAGVAIYSTTSYESLDSMDLAIEELDISSIERYEDFDEISYNVSNPLKQIVLIPGGLVEPDSYEYLAVKLALAGYNVTISKALFNLAIFMPNYANKFLSEDLDNIVVGHSLGGVVGGMLSSDNELVNQVVLMGSYPIRDLKDKEVLYITAENDQGMDEETFDASFELVKDDTEVFDILGGNHAQFGWYGPQKGDLPATITTIEQQDIVVSKILEFIN